MAGLADLVARRVLRDGGKGLEFVNELLRTAAYLGVPSPLRRALHSAIADQLMKSEDPPSGSFGLEIAWHCMRANRQAEARQYLMSGARHAIRAGAADSTERALTTALPALSGSERVDASLLLAEVLQEQGRSEEALDLLSSLRTDVSGARRERAIALEALAARYVAPVGDAMRALVPPLRDVVREAADVTTRALAARALAYLLFELRDEKMVVELLEMLDHFPREGLDMDSGDQLALARTLLLYQVGRRAAGLALASEALRESRRCGVANLATLQLQSGVGSILSSQGRYREAVAAFQDALEMAHRLGNDRHTASVSGNIALCLGRLGRYPEQLDWASKGLSHKRHITGVVVIQLAYCQAFALAMMGKVKEAIVVVGEMDARIPSLTPDWQVKAWSLWKADILLLVGKRTEALEAAHVAVADSTFGVETPAFGGPFARWMYFTRGAARNDVEARLAEMVGNLTRYDVLDQAEILCAYRLQTGRAFPGELWVQLQTILGDLPESVTVQLVSLGVLVKSEATLCHHIKGGGSTPSGLEPPQF
jgi:tetratricopeptide (TPR) repeat protein